MSNPYESAARARTSTRADLKAKVKGLQNLYPAVRIRSAPPSLSSRKRSRLLILADLGVNRSRPAGIAEGRMNKRAVRALTYAVAEALVMTSSLPSRRQQKIARNLKRLLAEERRALRGARPVRL